MSTLWFMSSPTKPAWQLDPRRVEDVIRVAFPAASLRREAADVPTLVWDDSRNEQWVEGRLRVDQRDSVVFRGWPELIVDHVLVLRDLVPEGSSVVLANDQGEVFDLRSVQDGDALLAAIDRDENR